MSWISYDHWSTPNGILSWMTRILSCLARSHVRGSHVIRISPHLSSIFAGVLAIYN